MHWAYIEWSPECDQAHTIDVKAEHAHKACANKSGPTEVEFECELTGFLPDVLRHTVSGETKDAVLAVARCWAYDFTQWGSSYTIVYIGEVKE